MFINKLKLIGSLRSSALLGSAFPVINIVAAVINVVAAVNPPSATSTLPSTPSKHACSSSGTFCSSSPPPFLFLGTSALYSDADQIIVSRHHRLCYLSILPFPCSFLFPIPSSRHRHRPFLLDGRFISHCHNSTHPLYSAHCLLHYGLASTSSEAPPAVRHHTSSQNPCLHSQ